MRRVGEKQPSRKWPYVMAQVGETHSVSPPNLVSLEQRGR